MEISGEIVLYANVSSPNINGGIIVGFDESNGCICIEQLENDCWVYLYDIIDIQALDEDWNSIEVMYSKERGDTEEDLCSFLNEHFESEDE